MVVDTVVVDEIVVADTAIVVVVAEDQRSSTAVVETSQNTCETMDLCRRLKCTFLWLSPKSWGKVLILRVTQILCVELMLCVERKCYA